MRLSSNTPKGFQELVDRTLNIAPIEDGNTLGLSQGIIYTSEFVNTTAYDTVDGYSAPVVSNPTYTYGKDGKIYTVIFDVSYPVYQEPGATTPGYYGSDLLHIGDIFTIKGTDKDYVRGIVSAIKDITTVEDWSVYTFTFTIYAIIEQGDPKKIAIGDNFVWKRKLFLDENNQNNSTIAGLDSSYNILTREIFFYWDETNPLAVKHKLSIRRSTNIYPSYILNAPGTKINSTSTLTAFVNKADGDISTIRINDADNELAFNREVLIKGSGTGAKWATDIDANGSLLMNTYTVTDATVGGNSLKVNAPTTVPATFSRSGGYMLPYTGTYVSGLTGLSGTVDFYVGGISGATADNRIFYIQLFDASTGVPVSITDTWRNGVIGKEIKTHDGVYRISNGAGYTGASGTIASLKVLPENINWYWDPIFGAIGSTGQSWAWSVCSGYQNTGGAGNTGGVKNYSQWSFEDYFNT